MADNQNPACGFSYRCGRADMMGHSGKSQVIGSEIFWAFIGGVFGLLGMKAQGWQHALDVAVRLGKGYAVAFGLLGLCMGVAIPQERWISRVRWAASLSGWLAVAGMFLGAFTGLVFSGLEDGIVWLTGGWEGKEIATLIGMSTGAGLRLVKHADEDMSRYFVRLLAVTRCAMPPSPVSLDPSWLTPTVKALASAIHEENVFDRMPILADAWRKQVAPTRKCLLIAGARMSM